MKCKAIKKELMRRQAKKGSDLLAFTYKHSSSSSRYI